MIFNKYLISTAFIVFFMFSIAGAPAIFAAGPATVNLGTASNYVILSKTGISTTGSTLINGDIGVSPIAASAITGFALTLPAGSAFSTSPLVTGKVYASDYANPTPANLTTAVLDMQTAYTDAAGRSLNAITELGAGNIGGLTLAPGLYKWGTGLTIPTDVTLSGSANDIWIFQIAQNLNLSSATHIVLSGGAQASNVFWQVAGQTTIGTTAVFNGNILDQTAIVLNTGATLNGRALAQTAVTLDSNAVTMPTFVTPTPQPTCISNWQCYCGSPKDYNNCGLLFTGQMICPQICISPAPTPTPQPSCSNLYWFDSTNTTCQSQRQLCGAYMYQGLQTFYNQQDCYNAVATQRVIPVIPSPSATDRQALIAQITAQINTLRGQVNAQLASNPNASAIANASANAFNRNLTVGSAGVDVKVLQVWLNTHGYAVASSGPGSSGNETTTFGGLTRAALAKFQAAVGINPPLGNFGIITRAYLATH